VSINDSVPGDYVYEAVLKELNESLPMVRETNTLFINFWAVEERSAKYRGDVGAELVKKLFALCAELDYIVWLCPRTVKLTDYQKRTFMELEYPGDGNDVPESSAF
jgi:hypothetical protein